MPPPQLRVDRDVSQLDLMSDRAVLACQRVVRGRDEQQTRERPVGLEQHVTWPREARSTREPGEAESGETVRAAGRWLPMCMKR